jgi:hypothetical protein
VKSRDSVDVEGAGCRQLGVELLWRQDLYAARCEGATDQRPVGFHEAQHTVERHVGTEVADDVDLFDDALDNATAVPVPDKELLDSGALRL